jgi:hypothetical protein
MFLVQDAQKVHHAFLPYVMTFALLTPVGNMAADVSWCFDSSDHFCLIFFIYTLISVIIFYMFGKED